MSSRGSIADTACAHGVRTVQALNKLVVPKDPRLPSQFQPPVKMGVYPQFQESPEQDGSSSKKIKVPDALRPLQLCSAEVESCIASLQTVMPQLDREGLYSIVELVTVLVNDLALSRLWGDASGTCWYAKNPSCYGRRSVELTRFAPLVPCTLGLLSSEGNRHTVSCAFFFDLHYYNTKFDGGFMPFADMPLETHVGILRELVHLPRALQVLNQASTNGVRGPSASFVELLRTHDRDDDVMRKLTIILVPVWHRFYFTMMSNFVNVCAKMQEQHEAHQPIITYELLDKTEDEVEPIVDYMNIFFKMAPTVIKTFSVLTNALLQSEASAFGRPLGLFTMRPLPGAHNDKDKLKCNETQKRGCAFCGKQLIVGENDCNVLSDHTGSLVTFDRMPFGDPVKVRILAKRVHQAGLKMQELLEKQAEGGSAAVGVKIPHGVNSDKLLMRRLLWTNGDTVFPENSPRQDLDVCTVSMEEATFLHREETIYTSRAMREAWHAPSYTTASVFKLAHEEKQMPLYMPTEPSLGDLYQFGFILRHELLNPGYLDRMRFTGSDFMFDIWDDTSYGCYPMQSYVKNTSYNYRSNLLFHVASPVAGLEEQYLDALDVHANTGLDAVYMKLSQIFMKTVRRANIIEPRGSSSAEHCLEQVLSAKWVLVCICNQYMWLPGGGQTLPAWTREFLELLQRDEGIYLNVVNNASEERVAAFEEAVARATAVLRKAVILYSSGEGAAFDSHTFHPAQFRFWRPDWVVACMPTAVADPMEDRRWKLRAVTTAKATLRYLHRFSPTAVRNYVGIRESIWYCMWGLYGAGRDWTEDPEHADDGTAYKSQGPDFPGKRDENFYLTRLSLGDSDALTSMQQCCTDILGIYASGGMIDSNLCAHCKTPFVLDVTQHPAPLEGSFGVDVPFKPAETNPAFNRPHPLPQWGCVCILKPRTITFEQCYTTQGRTSGAWTLVSGVHAFPTVNDIDYMAGANQFYPPDSIPLPEASFLPPEPVLVEKLKQVFWEGVTFQDYCRYVKSLPPSDDHFLIIARCARMLMPRRMRRDDIRFRPADVVGMRIQDLYIDGNGLKTAPHSMIGKVVWKDRIYTFGNHWWEQQMVRLVRAVNTMRMNSDSISSSSFQCHLCTHKIGETFAIPQLTPKNNVPGLEDEKPCDPEKWIFKGFQKPLGKVVSDSALYFTPAGVAKFMECVDAVTVDGSVVHLRRMTDLKDGRIWNFSLCFNFGGLYVVPSPIAAGLIRPGPFATPFEINEPFKTSTQWADWKRYEWERVWHTPTIRGGDTGARTGMIPGFVCCGKIHKHRCTECESVGPSGKGAIVFLPDM